MKQLDATFVLDNNKFTQVKRSDKAALYKRETMEGALVSYEVFSIRIKNDAEVYPKKHAFGGILAWAWCPITMDRAELYYGRLERDEVLKSQVDPETGELPVDQSAVIVTLPILNQEVSLEAQPVNEPDIVDPTDPTALPAPLPTVTATIGGAKLVEVAKVTPKEIIWKIPTGEFTQAEFARANKLPERGVVWSRLDKLVRDGKLNKSMKQLGKGRPTAIFSEKK
jgi:hypothetical protein